MFGKEYEEVGSNNKGLILKSSGDIKIQWGKKFINLLDENGNINSQIKNIIQEISSISNAKQNGFYIVDNSVYLKFNNKIIEISSDYGNTYVSFLTEQNNSEEQKYKALKNIGFVYPNQETSNVYPTNGIIYFEDSQQLYIVENGNLKEYNVTIPKPYSEQFVISKDSSDSSEGAIIIEGSGIDNCLKFDTLKIYSNKSNSVIYFKNELNFNINNKSVLNLTTSGIETENIQSFGADKNSGFRIYKINNKYVLDIDKINPRESISELKSNISTKSYNKENIILDTNIISSNENNQVTLNYQFSFKYENKYQVGDIIRTYIEVQLDEDNFYTLIPVQFQITGISELNQAITDNITYLIQETDENISKLYKIIENDGVEERYPRYTTIQNSYCYLSNNQDLVIGELQQSDKYNNKETGIISKQNILYSTKFDKDGSGSTVFPFYSSELEQELENHYNDPTYENVIPTIKIIKRLIAGT